MYIFLIIQHTSLREPEIHESSWDEHNYGKDCLPSDMLGEFYKYAIYQERTCFEHLSTEMSADEFNDRYNSGQRLFYLKDETTESIVAMLDKMPPKLTWLDDLIRTTKNVKKNLADYDDLVCDVQNYLDGRITREDLKEVLDKSSKPTSLPN